jgi:hypothetical protein
MTVWTARLVAAVVVVAAVVDVIAVLVFAAIGRDSHAESVNPLDVLKVAAPFLVGTLVGWLVGRIWRDPLRLWPGVAVWAGTVVVGLALRAAVLHRLPASFVLVTSASLAVFLLGWRGIVLIAVRARRRNA